MVFINFITSSPRSSPALHHKGLTYRVLARVCVTRWRFPCVFNPQQTDTFCNGFSLGILQYFTSVWLLHGVTAAKKLLRACNGFEYAVECGEGDV